MRRDELRNPLLVRLYHRYLGDPQPASFMMNVSACYSLSTLGRVAMHGDRESRRAAVLALTFLGGYEQRHVFASALKDVDRGVRMLGEEGINDIWCRAGNVDQQHRLRAAKRRNEGGDFHGAHQITTELCLAAPRYGEAWNQKAISEFFLGRITDSIQSCNHVLFINPLHFEAAVGLGHAFLEVNEPHAALESFSQALELNPHLDGIRAFVAQVQRTL